MDTWIFYDVHHQSSVKSLWEAAEETSSNYLQGKRPVLQRVILGWLSLLTLGVNGTYECVQGGRLMGCSGVGGLRTGS